MIKKYLFFLQLVSGRTGHSTNSLDSTVGTVPCLGSAVGMPCLGSAVGTMPCLGSAVGTVPCLGSVVGTVPCLLLGTLDYTSASLCPSKFVQK